MKSLALIATASGVLLSVSFPGSADASLWGYDSARVPCDQDRVVTPCPGASEAGMMGAFSNMMGRWFGSGALPPATQTADESAKTATTAPENGDAEVATAYQNL